MQRLTGKLVLAVRRRFLAGQPEAPCQRHVLAVGHGCQAVPRGDRVVECTRCGIVIEPLDALAEGGTRGKVLLERALGGLGLGPSARQAPRLVEGLFAGLVESARHVFPGLDVAHDIRPLLLDGGSDPRGRERVAGAGQALDGETQLELTGVLLHADRGPLVRARGEKRPGALADALRGVPAVGDRA